jgi:Flp pilus assembly protein TadB
VLVEDGYAAGEAAVRAIGNLSEVGEVVGAIALTGVILAFVKWQRTRRERKAARRAAVRTGASPSAAEVTSGSQTD